MGIFYQASNKELLEIRNKIFTERGIPALNKHGFQKSPFSNAFYGKYERGSFYAYNLCRITNESFLEIIEVFIIRGDKWIQIRLNIFELEPDLKSLEQLNGIDGIQFSLKPNNITNMRLNSDDFKGTPLLNYNFMFRNHKIKFYLTKMGLQRSANKLGNIIESDLNNIEKYVKKWHNLHKPLITTWNGIPERFNKMNISEKLAIYNP